MKKITALEVFEQLTRELGRMPRLDEFLDTGYKKTTYYRVKNEFKGLQDEREKESERELLEGIKKYLFGDKEVNVNE